MKSEQINDWRRHCNSERAEDHVGRSPELVSNLDVGRGDKHFPVSARRTDGTERERDTFAVGTLLPLAGASESARSTKRRHQFPLSGIQDVNYFEVLQQRTFSNMPGRPVSHSLAGRVLLALDCIDKTVAALSPTPTAKEVDASNIRRLITLVLPAMKCLCNDGAAEDVDKAIRRMHHLAQAVGTYKDAAVIGKQCAKELNSHEMDEVRALLTLERETRAEDFLLFLTKFRTSWPRSYATLKHYLGARQSARNDAGALAALANAAQHQAKVVEKNERHAKRHRDFHACRKDMRQLLNIFYAAEKTFSVRSTDVDTLAALVKNYGKAQDTLVAALWLKDHGFCVAATKVLAAYRSARNDCRAEARRAATRGVFRELSRCAKHAGKLVHA